MASGTHAAPPAFIRLAHHPVRWRLLSELAAGDLRVRELVQRVGQPQSLVSYHLRLLRGSGLVTARRSSYDGRDSYYHLDLERCADGLTSAGAALHPWLRTLPPPEDPPEDLPGAAAERVLFVCTGNSARSPIAEALLRHRAGGRVTVASAGISPKGRIHPHAIRALREGFGIDLRDQAPRAIAEVALPGSRFDRVVTLCDKAREHLPAHAARSRTHWSVADPADARGPASYAAFLSTSTDLDIRVRHLLPTLGAATATGTGDWG